MTEWLNWTELRQEKLKKLFMNELYCKVLSQKFHSSLIYKTSESQQRLYLEKLWRHRLNNTTVSVNSNNKVREKNFTMKKKWRKKVYNENMPGCSVTRMCLILCDPMDCSTPDFPVHHQLPELAQTHVHQVSDAIQPSHPLSSPSPPTFNLSQHQSLFQWVSFSHQVTKVLEFQFQHQSFQWIFRTDFL